ncbi:conserved hypothetical protein [Pyrenophora tritici-repentis Pt-1C-BFP]|uniref:Uncharacterized protein n=1 Tax=Pyrenophora tritici-repentis (strain Pt-1C-BFP) TaxID=426418 RepID=B2VSQ5_PYRTR|nr:uncharacterized protein PTRG_01811 [Pyrenophora tritici-repentis Pt-1C-BFP]EDU41249.1 conserved hypothetical protein [Pyrenophora tritici-repentis Pt-1C-BFP]
MAICKYDAAFSLTQLRWIHINSIWDRTEKVLFLLLDGYLNYYFIRVVNADLVRNGLTKYNRLVRFNKRIIVVSLSLDVMIIGAMSIPNGFVYAMFHPLAYIVKLNIEMSMAHLIKTIVLDNRHTVCDPHLLLTYKSSPESDVLNTNLFAEVPRHRLSLIRGLFGGEHVVFPQEDVRARELQDVSIQTTSIPDSETPLRKHVAKKEAGTSSGDNLSIYDAQGNRNDDVENVTGNDENMDGIEMLGGIPPITLPEPVLLPALFLGVEKPTTAYRIVKHQFFEMKGVFAFASFVAIAIAADPKLSKAKPSISLNPLARRNYAATYCTLHSNPKGSIHTNKPDSTPPEPTDSYPVSSVIEIPPPQPTECLDTDPDPCSTVLITVTSIHTISVSHVPSSLISEPPTTSDQSSATVPPESAPATETEKSSTAAPEESTVGTTTDIQTETSLEPGTPIATATETATESELSTSLPSDITLSISIIEGSSVAPPEAPFPTATDEPTQTSATGTGSYTASPTLPEFTAAADAVRVPAVVVGVLGWAALMM